LNGLPVFVAEGGPCILAILFVALWFVAGNQRKILLLEATWAAVLDLVVNQVTGLFYFHPRPYMIGSLVVGSMSAWFVRFSVTLLRQLNERFIHIFNQGAGRLFGKSERPAERQYILCIT
jgi:hypothetical protein